MSMTSACQRVGPCWQRVNTHGESVRVSVSACLYRDTHTHALTPRSIEDEKERQRVGNTHSTVGR